MPRKTSKNKSVGVACNYDFKAYIITVAEFRDGNEIKVKIHPNGVHITFFEDEIDRFIDLLKECLREVKSGEEFANTVKTHLKLCIENAKLLFKNGKYKITDKDPWDYDFSKIIP